MLVSLIETCRVDGKIHHEHVASLGSVLDPPSVDDRLVFWQRLHERLAKLANRVDPAMQGKVLGAIHARIPMVLIDEQRDVQLRNAEHDKRFWSDVRDMQQDTVLEQRALAATVERAIAAGQAAADDAAAKAASAKERVERLRKGEDVPGGLGKPFTREDFERILRDAGWTASDFRRADLLRAVSDLGEEVWEEFLRDMHKFRERAVHAAARAVLRKRSR